MRDFLAIFPSIYLVDNIPFWVIFITFYRWYDDHSSWDAFIVQTLIAVLLSGVARLLQERPIILFGSWFVRPIDDNETIRNMVIAGVLLFPGLLGYGDVIELTGSPSSDQMFLVGKIRSMLMMGFILVAIYAFEEKWKDLLGPTTPLYHHNTTKTNIIEKPSLFRCNRVSPQWLLYLGAIQSIAIFIDLLVHQAFFLTYSLLALLFGLVAAFIIFNACWINRIQKAYKES